MPQRTLTVSTEGWINFFLLTPLSFEALGTLTHKFTDDLEHHTGSSVETVASIRTFIHEGMRVWHHPDRGLGRVLSHDGLGHALVHACVGLLHARDHQL